MRLEELRDDRDVVLAAVLDKGMALEYASKELQAAAARLCARP